MVQSNLFFRECFLALDLGSLLPKADKYKESKTDDIGSRVEARRYSSLVSEVRTHQGLEKLLAEMVALGREKMTESARATIGHALKKALDSYVWSNFSDGVLGICLSSRNEHRLYPTTKLPNATPLGDP